MRSLQPSCRIWRNIFWLGLARRRARRLLFGVWLLPALAGGQPIPWASEFTLTNSQHRLKVNGQAVRDDYGIWSEVTELNISADNSGIRILNVRGREVFQGRVFKGQLPVGHYFMESATDRANLGVVPRGGALAVVGHDASIYMQASKAVVNTDWVRIWVGWRPAEFEAGSWNFTKATEHNYWVAPDRVVAAIQGRRWSMASLGRGPSLPPWIYDRDAGQWRVTKQEYLLFYRRFLRQLWERYGPWEVTETCNEPTWHDEAFPFESPAITSPATHAARIEETIWFVTEIAKIIREECPTSKISGPATNGPNIGLQNYARALRPYLDIINFHDYSLAKGEPEDEGNPWSLGSIATGIRRWREHYGNLPVHITECGMIGDHSLGYPTGRDSWSTPSAAAVSWYTGMCRNLRYWILALAEGNVILIPHRLFIGDTGELSGFSPRGPQPKITACIALAQLLNGYQPVFPPPVHENHLERIFERDGRRLHLVWCRDGQSTGAYRHRELRDVFGQPWEGDLGQEPLYWTEASATKPNQASPIPAEE